MIRLSRSEMIQTAVAVTALLIGVLVYLLDRHADSVYFMAQWMVWDENVLPLFGTIGNQLPTFVHVYAFILLTAILVTPARAYVIPICLFWFIIDSLFELAQINVIAQWIVKYIPAWFYKIPFLENTSDYFLAGKFYILDIFSITAGTLAAYLTIVISTRRIANHAYTI